MHDTFVDNSFDLENSINNILSIRVSPGGFSFSVVNLQNNKLLAFNHSTLKISNEHFIPRRFGEWIDSETILQNKYGQTHVYVDTPKFTFVPEPFFE